MRVSALAPTGRYLSAWVLGAAAMLLSACSGGSSRAALPVTVGNCASGVCLSGANSVQQGGTLALTAAVAGDTNKLGVSWALDPATGAGTLTNETTTNVTYAAPSSGVIGTVTPVITATSIADTTKKAGGTLIVLGAPVIEATTLFPGNVSSPYGAAINVSGGLAPFTWTLGSGPLPPGITLATTSTSASTTISGTPTAAGVYNFSIKVTDKNSAVATVPLQLEIKAAAACLLDGPFVVLYSGFVSNQVAVGGSSVNISATGTISGYHDFTTASAPVAETLSGTCTTRTSNNGTLTIKGTASSPQYDYAVTTGLNSGRVQLMNGGDSQSGSGQFIKQDPAAFVLSSLAGHFAFGALGAQANGTRLGIAGAVAIDVGGVITSGQIDTNGSNAITDAPLTGTLSTPDTTSGRGTLTLTSGSQSFHFAYYIVDLNRLAIVSIDSASRVLGFMTRQSGAFDNSSLASPAVLSLWGAAATTAPKTVLDLGRLSNANATAGTLDLLLDSANPTNSVTGQSVTGAAYAVRSTDGRATLDATIGSVTRHFALYLDGAANGYVIEHGVTAGSAGLLEAQTGPFKSTIPGLFVSGTQYAADVAPILLLPSVRLAAGTLSASSATGSFALDTATGRGIGTLNATGSGNGVFVLYVIGPKKVVTLRFGAAGRSAVMDWLGS